MRTLILTALAVTLTACGHNDNLRRSEHTNTIVCMHKSQDCSMRPDQTPGARFWPVVDVTTKHQVLAHWGPPDDKTEDSLTKNQKWHYRMKGRKSGVKVSLEFGGAAGELVFNIHKGPWDRPVIVYPGIPTQAPPHPTKSTRLEMEWPTHRAFLDRPKASESDYQALDDLIAESHTKDCKQP